MDVQEMREAVGRGVVLAERGRHEEAFTELDAAIRLWDEPLVEDAYEEWSQGYVRDLKLLHLQALEESATVALLLGRTATAAHLAARAAEEDPYSERIALLRARALAASGHRASALVHLSAFRDRLRMELQAEVSAAVNGLERSLRDDTLWLTVSRSDRIDRVSRHTVRIRQRVEARNELIQALTERIRRRQDLAQRS